MFEKIEFGGVKQICEPVKLSVFRALTDNDSVNELEWRSSGKFAFVPKPSENFDNTTVKIYSSKIDGSVITFTGALSPVARSPLMKFTLKYEIFGSRIKISLNGKIRENLTTYIPRLGFEFRTPAENDTFSYYGRGPEENYADMKTHTPIGYYKSRASDEYVPYVLPQEHGNHTDTKLLKTGTGLSFESDK